MKNLNIIEISDSVHNMAMLTKIEPLHTVNFGSEMV